ncbi:NIPA protein, partial [Pitta sordida]|nr:NIPA protein [Pitta sordida]
HPLKWAGKPLSLSPLVCARFGWANVECDVLRCSSCQAFLGGSIHLGTDLGSYQERCEELLGSLCSAHEKFCFWPDSPCPARFALLPVDEPRVLLQEFLGRFQRLCQLELQLPSLRPEDLRNMSLTEERISLLLQLLEEQLEPRKPLEAQKSPGKFSTEALQVPVPACVLALCGWDRSSRGSPALPVISCCRCRRRVGLWGFQQLESTAPEGDPCAPSLPASPRRMLTRSQDPAAEQEKSPSPASCRARGRDSPVSLELEVCSPRSRPVTRSMGQGDGVEVPSSPLRRPKRPRLCSSSSS